MYSIFFDLWDIGQTHMITDIEAAIFIGVSLAMLFFFWK